MKRIIIRRGQLGIVPVKKDTNQSLIEELSNKSFVVTVRKRRGRVGMPGYESIPLGRVIRIERQREVGIPAYSFKLIYNAFNYLATETAYYTFEIANETGRVIDYLIRDRHLTRGEVITFSEPRIICYVTDTIDEKKSVLTALDNIEVS